MTLNARISVLVYYYINSYIVSFVFFEVARREAILLAPPLNPPLQWSEYIPAIQLVKLITKKLGADNYTAGEGNCNWSIISSLFV